MRNAIHKIQNPELPLRSRMFQLLSTIAMAEFIIVSVYTVVTGGDTDHIVMMLIGTVLFACTVTYTFRSDRMRLGSTISGLLYFLLYPLTFFSSGGMYGGAPVVFAFALVYVFLVTEKWERILALAVCITASGICFAVSYLSPDLLDRHTVLMEHAESFLSILLVTVLLCCLFAFVTGVYQTENHIVQEQKKEIEELNQSQKRFFSNMSHEIRTPVNAIIGLNEMTLREDISDEVRENAMNIEVAGRILLHTVNEILDMSKLETGGMEIVCSDYKTTAMLSDIVNMIWLRAEEKGLEFRISAEPSLPKTLNGDEIRIRQILLNVLTNAVKYTKSGSVTLTITSRMEDDRLFMIYDVTDTGIGIKEESIPYLFTAFQRLDSQKTHTIEGTGLGLSIVKQLLDMMDGTVQVKSEYGKGSTFLIEIPQKVVDGTAIGEIDFRKKESRERTKPEPPIEVPELRILAVDDTPMNLMVVRKLLRETKATVDTASSGAEALDRTAENRYDIILMDHQMPEMDGIECLHRIRDQENGKCKDSKIVCLTANVGAEMEKQFMQEGFDGYLRKPVNGKILESELVRLTTVDLIR